MLTEKLSIRLSQYLLKQLETYSDCFETTRTELVRNWLEDIFSFLDLNLMEIDRKRHLKLINLATSAETFEGVKET